MSKLNGNFKVNFFKLQHFDGEKLAKNDQNRIKYDQKRKRKTFL